MSSMVSIVKTFVSILLGYVLPKPIQFYWSNKLILFLLNIYDNEKCNLCLTQSNRYFEKLVQQ